MATVTSFESVAHPSKSELRQFAELFTPLFQASTDEARRQAVASLSQNPHVPAPVALFIGSQPIAIAAPFLISSPCLSDDLLVMIARTQGAAHAHAIARRAALSPGVIDALVGLRQVVAPDRAAVAAAATEGRPDGPLARPRRRTAAAALPAHALIRTPKSADTPDVMARIAESPELLDASLLDEALVRPVGEDITIALKEQIDGNAPSLFVTLALSLAEPDTLQDAEDAAKADRADREEVLRQNIKQLAAHIDRPRSDRLGLRTVTPVQEALLVRFARGREAGHFATTLADALSSSRWLAERVMLDISGRQMAVTLVGLGMDFSEAEYVLTRLYSHLAAVVDGESRAKMLLDGLDVVDCEERIDAWRRADSYTYDRGQTGGLAESGADEADPVPARRAGLRTPEPRTAQVLRGRKR